MARAFPCRTDPEPDSHDRNSQRRVRAATDGASRVEEGAFLGVDLVTQDDDGWRASVTETMRSSTKEKTAEFYMPKLDDAALVER